MVTPILKWPGGKRELLTDIYKLFPENYNAYHEPMLGGGAVLFDLEPDTGTVNDTNTRLMNFYTQVKQNPTKLINALDGFSAPESSPNPNQEFAKTARDGSVIENYYYQQRELFNARPNDEDFTEVLEAARLLYLNRTCFNGLYRENSAGEFNSPIGSYENPDWIRRDEIRAASSVLENVTLHNTDFTYIQREAAPNDVVYFDPPYKPVSASASFTEYSADGFDAEAQQQLIDVVQTLDENNVYFVLSNSGVMYDKYADKGLYVQKKNVRREINSDGQSRGEVTEILVTNVPPHNRQTVGQQQLVSYNNTNASTD